MDSTEREKLMEIFRNDYEKFKDEVHSIELLIANGASFIDTLRVVKRVLWIETWPAQQLIASIYDKYHNTNMTEKLNRYNNVSRELRKRPEE